MKKSEKTTPEKPVRRERKALTPESREEQMIGLAIDAAEELLLAKKAPSQIITHYLKMGSMKERKEVERLNKEIELMQAKIDALESSQRMEDLYAKAIEYMQIYKGNPNNDIE